MGETKKGKRTIKPQARKSLSSRKPTSLTREFSAGGIVYKRSLALRAKRVKEPFGKTKDKRECGKVEVMWLVTKSTPSELYPKGAWRLPKGWLDDKDNGKEPGPLASGKKRASEKQIKEAAIREVAEEGGVGAKIVTKIGTEKYFFTLLYKRILKFVTFYLMEWKKDLSEGPGFETEKVEWLLYSQARERLSCSGEKKILDKAKQVLDREIQDQLL